jgi:alpha-L-rhamnosidase
MKDVATDQLDSGAVPHVVPNVLGENASGSAGWADAATIIPWNSICFMVITGCLKRNTLA